MKNAWVGYLGSALSFVAGILMLVAKRYLAGVLFIVVAVVWVVVKYKMNQKNVTNLTKDTTSIGDADTAMMASTADTMTEEGRTSNENTEEIDTATTGIGEAQDEKSKGTKEEKKSNGVGQYVEKKGMC